MRTALSCAPIQKPNEALQPTAPPLVLSSFVLCSAAVFLSSFARGASAELGRWALLKPAFFKMLQSLFLAINSIRGIKYV